MWPTGGKGGDTSWNIAIKFGMEKLEWCGYPTVNKIEDTITRFDTIHERDRQKDRRTHRQCMTA